MNFKKKIELNLKKIPPVYSITKFLFGLARKFFSFLFPENTTRGKAAVSSLKRVTGFINDIYVIYKFFRSKPVNRKIAVHIHLYYPGFNDELISCLKNMPFRYDLFLTITKIEEKEIIEEYFTSRLKMTMLNLITVQAVPDIGRDWAPLIINLKPSVFQYDYFCHLHTNKSLYSGIGRDKWRDHLYNSLLGSPEIIKKIIKKMEDDHLGILYPAAFKDMPYWAHHRLSNKRSAKSLGEKIGITFNTSQYTDFPAGSMFWFRPDALSKLFNAGFKITDFPNEPIADDGTILHAIERSVCTIAENKKYSYGEFDLSKDIVRINNGAKNLDQYWNKTAEKLYLALKKYNYISFDIFDTLISRKIKGPDNLFNVVENRIFKQLGLRIKFHQVRKLAESELRSRLVKGKDVTIHQIYDKIKELTGLSDDNVDDMMNIEIQTELDFSAPRNDIIELVKKLLTENKKIYLISDMYLTSDIIKTLLARHDFPVSDVEILVSSDTGLRKDNGTAWDAYKDLIEIHVGDNEHSDVQLCSKRNIVSYHIMSSSRLFELSFKPDLSIFKSTGDSIISGLVLSKIYNSPLFFKQNKG